MRQPTSPLSTRGTTSSHRANTSNLSFWTKPSLDFHFCAILTWWTPVLKFVIILIMWWELVLETNSNKQRYQTTWIYQKWGSSTYWTEVRKGKRKSLLKKKPVSAKFSKKRKQTYRLRRLPQCQENPWGRANSRIPRGNPSFEWSSRRRSSAVCVSGRRKQRGVHVLICISLNIVLLV